MSPALRALFVDYAESHRHPTNRLTHKLAIPLIVFHIVAMLDWVRLFQVGGFTVTLAMVAVAAALVWYLRMSVKLGLMMAVFLALCFPLGRMTPWPVVVAIAVGGWLVQLAGHSVWEKKSPAFLTNLLQALVGPIFFLACLTGDWREGQTSAEPVGAGR
ncbi:DUF962 domain-containing protein [Aggregicoccus sp. 17bor-14]|uniref:Mpo1 family 2-hydroxy fatty acid dioxygenase n=1 Tax=Myxococcaceae TaxID=31 RepID=UPI00129D04F6|nr:MULTISPECIES: Mpo1-like protein [Myxococcaceae]MBF5046637.1 DUF962 domain-containing protein [Simulacricoccus sp. 17bor-14]MRI92347.1 DUF962 domain-containing protein [Aggregicoccus sp. 17bor-14]